MKRIFFTLAMCAMLAMGACKSKSGSNAANPDGSNSGGASETPAKSNLDSTNDSAKMPAHVPPDSVSDTTKRK